MQGPALHFFTFGKYNKFNEFWIKNKNMHNEYITITNCIIHAGLCAFRIGVGTGTIKHVRISNITVSRCRDLMQFATSYLNKGCACIEDVSISGISATDTERALSLFAGNGAYIKDVTIENIRSDAAGDVILFAKSPGAQ